jgi:hypothetical protein
MSTSAGTPVGLVGVLVGASELELPCVSDRRWDVVRGGGGGGAAPDPERRKRPPLKISEG